MVHQRLFVGGVPCASSPAFLFVPNPNVTLDRSPPSDPVCEGESTAEEIRENPGLGAGELELMPEEGPGLAFADIKDCICGAGSVMNPVSTACCAPFPSFFFLVFSVLPFDNVGASKNSAA
jgi:hypothetical protein